MAKAKLHISNISVSDSPPHVQIHLSLGDEQQDSSQSSHQQDYGKSGGEPEESVHAEYAISPASFLDCGVANCGGSHFPISLRFS